jgi:multicomponent Na+:H+ antiporter subunit E
LRRILLFVAAFALWAMFTWVPDQQEMLAGAVVSAGIALLFSEIFVINAAKVFSPRRWIYFFRYMPMFLYYVVLANLDVAYRVIHPRLPINPGIVKIKTSLKSEIAQTMLANSITLTPGTLSVDIKDGDMYIHWIDVKSQDVEEATKMIAQRFEKYLKEIFE